MKNLADSKPLTGTMERFKQLKQEILDIATPSSNPDDFTDLEDALNEIEKGLEIAYGVSTLQPKGKKTSQVKEHKSVVHKTYSIKPTSLKQQDWRKEFDKKFYPHSLSDVLVEVDTDQLEAFISTLLASQLSTIQKEIIGEDEKLHSIDVGAISWESDNLKIARNELRKEQRLKLKKL